MAGAQSMTDRMTDYFKRQIALYDEMLAAYETLPTDLQADDLDLLAERQAGFTRRVDQLAEELRLLTREWRETASLSEAERDHVRGLARHAEALAAQLEGISNEAASQAQAKSGEVKRQLDGLRRGHQTLTKYRGAEGDSASGYVDTKA